MDPSNCEDMLFSEFYSKLHGVVVCVRKVYNYARLTPRHTIRSHLASVAVIYHKYFPNDTSYVRTNRIFIFFSFQMVKVPRTHCLFYRFLQTFPLLRFIPLYEANARHEAMKNWIWNWTVNHPNSEASRLPCRTHNFTYIHIRRKRRWMTYSHILSLPRRFSAPHIPQPTYRK